MSGKKLAITLGDPAGISPEILVKSVEKLPPNIYIIYGSKGIIDFYLKKYNKKSPFVEINSPKEAKNKGFYLINIYDKNFIPSKPSKETGKASVLYLEKAVNDILNKKVDALITLPISKEYVMLSGFKYAGHTDYLAEVSKAEEYSMVLICEKLKVALITTHIPLKDVAKNITKEKVYSKVKLVDKELKEKLKIKKPKIALLGLNPHAGDGGNIGKEEIEILIPVAEKLRKEGIDITNPLSADTAFNKYKEFDIYIAMYHDQGLIPLKLLCFRKAVNITFGLPFIRTSPDHGTGFDIAGQDKADPSSLIEAVKLADKLI
ncbi:4-hydroxythreonine-4-phosphate dehydrogenase PdxA [Hydrogenothermus marinus]|uniref:4-hydroxythreonine-4-phosphate dehydrogenase n=1 Tax=Hydrogenothermus marinus TaxID=133270 RepID=A0A3M0BRA7_9AQUI|nr:4-hydroxythreonine-4-phosphate dehydrogenase PdxA [Hydrogenothermus marinus]RMA97035.1 4-hydroxythreonine-4-phosphate dehydrogenase [Hydrogenothermus marinus]